MQLQNSVGKIHAGMARGLIGQVKGFNSAGQKARGSSHFCTFLSLKYCIDFKSPYSLSSTIKISCCPPQKLLAFSWCIFEEIDSLQNYPLIT